MRDLHSKDPTQERCPRVDHAGYTAPAWQHYLHHEHQEPLWSERSKSLTVVGTDHTDNLACSGTWSSKI